MSAPSPTSSDLPLAGYRPDPARLKIIILSAPKTGNTWLRWLLHYAYGVPQVELPAQWDPQAISELPDKFVAHQHYAPSEELLDWLVANRVAVLSTIRHPADTFLSLFHYVQWHEDPSDPYQQLLRNDGGKPGSHALQYARRHFPLVYALTLAWAKLGSHVVRYEDLLADPVAELGRVAARVGPVDPRKLTTAAFLARADSLAATRSVDARHLRTRTARRWTSELPDELVESLRSREPFASASRQYGFDWDAAAPEPAGFDYSAIDPFAGRREFDNGQPIGAYLMKVYLADVVGASERFPDPTRTAGDSFWNWLVAPSEAARQEASLPPESFTNLMHLVYESRADLKSTYPDVLGRDRIAYLTWFIGFACHELGIPWGIVSNAIDAHIRYLRARAPVPESAAGRIAAVRVLDDAGREREEFHCGEEVRVELDIEVDEPLEDAVVGYSLRSPDGAVIFGTNTRLLGLALPRLDRGRHSCTIRSRLTVPAGYCFVSVGLARFQADGSACPVHRLFDQKRLTVLGADAFGGAWCATSVAMRPA